MDAEILASVRALGRYPIEHSAPSGDEELKERNLQRKIKYHWKRFSRKTVAELEEFRAASSVDVRDAF